MVGLYLELDSTARGGIPDGNRGAIAPNAPFIALVRKLRTVPMTEIPNLGKLSDSPPPKALWRRL